VLESGLSEDGFVKKVGRFSSNILIVFCWFLLVSEV